MAESLTITFETDREWNYTIQLSEADAQQILAAPIGAQLNLTEPGAAIFIGAGVITHEKQTKIGARREDMPSDAFLRKLQFLIADDAWSD